MENILQEKSFKNLKVNYLDSDNIVCNFRQLLTKYKVHFEKIKHYSWSNMGSECHELNKEFKTIYQIIENKINLIDNRVYDFNPPPQMKIENALKNVNMKDKMNLNGLLYQVNAILNDFVQLHDSMLKTVNSSIDNTDSATKHIVTQFVHRLEEQN